MSYLKLITGIKTVLDEDSRIKTITEGEIDDFDQYKQNIFAIAHIVVNSSDMQDNLDLWQVDIDIVDYVTENNNITVDKFKGNSNRQEVYNDMANVCRRVFLKLRKFSFGDKIYVQDGATREKIVQFANDNRLVGWTVSFQVEVPDLTIDICQVV